MSSWSLAPSPPPQKKEKKKEGEEGEEEERKKDLSDKEMFVSPPQIKINNKTGCKILVLW